MRHRQTSGSGRHVTIKTRIEFICFFLFSPLLPSSLLPSPLPENEDAAEGERSGNPGYLDGKPVLAGVFNGTNDASTDDGNIVVRDQCCIVGAFLHNS